MYTSTLFAILQSTADSKKESVVNVAKNRISYTAVARVFLT